MYVIKMMLFSVILLCKAPALLIALISKRSRGARTFRRELLSAGLDPNHVEQLTRMYKAMLPPILKMPPLDRMKR